MADFSNLSPIVSEAEVQNAVYSRLPKSYYGFNGFHREVEAQTVNAKRADVLFVANKVIGKPYLIAVEAKSRKTIGHLKPQDSLERRLLISRWTTLVGVAILIAVTGYSLKLQGLAIPGAVGGILLSVIAISGYLKKRGSDFAKRIPVLDQLLLYPANEKWVAIAHDTFVNDQEFEVLKSSCQGAGIGLVVLDNIGELVVEVRPKPVHEKNGYLHKYLKAEDILDILEEYPSFGKSYPQLWKLVRQTLYFLLLGVSMFVLFTAKAGGLSKFRNNPSTLPFKPVLTGCNQFRSLDDNVFLLVEGGYSSTEQALQRMKELEGMDFYQFKFTKNECFRTEVTSEDYFIYVDEFYGSVDAAGFDAMNLVEGMGKRNLECHLCRPFRIRR